MTPLLAESEISPQIVIAVAFVVFSALKWIFDNLLKKPTGKAENTYTDTQDEKSSATLADLFEQYREKIHAIQTAPPPVIHAQPEVAPAVPIQKKYSSPPAPSAISTLPKKSTVANVSSLTKEEQAALERIKNGTVLGFSRKPMKRKGTGTHVQLRRFLDSPSHARQAIIIQEVLGQPKALSHQPPTGPHV